MNLRRLPPKTHGTLDYLTGVLFLAAPWIFGFYANRVANGVCIVAGVAVLAMALLTNYSTGVFRIIPYKMHLVVDVLLGLFVAASPWMFAFSNTVWVPHMFLGLAVIGIAAMSDPVTDASGYKNTGTTDRDLPANAPETTVPSAQTGPVLPGQEPSTNATVVNAEPQGTALRQTSSGSILPDNSGATPSSTDPSRDQTNETSSQNSGMSQNPSGVSSSRLPGDNSQQEIPGLYNEPGSSINTTNPETGINSSVGSNHNNTSLQSDNPQDNGPQGTSQSDLTNNSSGGSDVDSGDTNDTNQTDLFDDDEKNRV
jgi:hypothetical protein